MWKWYDSVVGDVGEVRWRVPELRLERERCLLTREELAEKAGLSWDTIRSIECGWHRPQVRTRRRILDALKLAYSEHERVCGPMRRF